VAGVSQDAAEIVLEAVRALDRAAQRGIIHRNAAARRKSRLMTRLHQLSLSPTETSGTGAKTAEAKPAAKTTAKRAAPAKTATAEKKPAARKPAARKAPSKTKE
jgi:hypothetical protein